MDPAFNVVAVGAPSSFDCHAGDFVFSDDWICCIVFAVVVHLFLYNPVGYEGDFPFHLSICS